jgi:hypothetical protein
MTLTDKFTIYPQVMARKVGDETVLLHLGSCTYFSLDTVGTRIWQLIGEGKSPVEICEVMLDEYEVSREDLECDTMKLVQELVAQDLVRPE